MMGLMSSYRTISSWSFPWMIFSMGVWTLRLSPSGVNLNYGLFNTFNNFSDNIVAHSSKVNVFSTSTKCVSRSFLSCDNKWKNTLNDSIVGVDGYCYIFKCYLGNWDLVVVQEGPKIFSKNININLCYCLGTYRFIWLICLINVIV